MASTKPRIGYDNAFLTNGYGCSSIDTDYPPSRLFDQRLSKFFKPASISSPAYVETAGNPTGNLVQNWFFANWTNGSNVAPDNWSVSNGTVSRGVSAGYIGINSAFVTQTSGSAELLQTISVTDEMKGRQVSFGGWVKAAAIGSSVLKISDGTTTTYSSANLNTAWEWLSVTLGANVSSSATEITISFGNSNPGGTARFDGACCQISSSVTQTPVDITIDYLGITGHTLYSTDCKITLQSSSDAYSTTTDRATITPSSDGTIFESFASATDSEWRLKIESIGSYTIIPSIAVFYAGEMLEMPEYPWTGFDPLTEEVTVKSASNLAGMSVGVEIRNNLRKASVQFKNLTRDFITGDYEAFREWAERNRNHFFFAHNEGLYPSEVWYVRIPDKYKFSAKTMARSYVDTVTINMEGVV